MPRPDHERPDPPGPGRPDAATGPGERTDPLTGAPTWVVPGRQDRPDRPDGPCPFCPGGLEAPEPYDVRAFPNRWPPFPEGRAEIVLYSPDHHASFADLAGAGARRVVDLWAERSQQLGADPAVGYVLVFENRGTEVGATIAHPHGQIYAFSSVPPVALRELEHDPAGTGLAPGAEGDRLVARAAGGWRAWVPAAATWPYELLVAPESAVPDLPSLDGVGRDGLGDLLAELVGRLDRLFDAPMPFTMWIHQRPFTGEPWPAARLHLHLAPLLRAPGTPRFVAAGELGSGVWFNPVDPAEAARRLREA